MIQEKNKNRTAYIYKITNLINNKIYIGQYRNIANNFSSYWGGGILINIAYKKYGKENFKKEIVVQGNFNKLLTDELEKHYIRLYNSNNIEIGYNLTKGGSGVPHTKETRLKISLANKGRIVSEETREKYRQAGYRRTYSPETIEKMRNAKLGRREDISVSKKRYKKVYQFSLVGKLLKKWNSVTEAANVLNIRKTDISNCARSTQTQSHGYIWVYDVNNLQAKVEKYNNCKYTQFQANKSIIKL